jgi:hypothetical protein
MQHSPICKSHAVQFHSTLKTAVMGFSTHSQSQFWQGAHTGAQLLSWSIAIIGIPYQVVGGV